MKKYYAELQAYPPKLVCHESNKGIVEYEELCEMMHELPNPYDWFEVVCFSIEGHDFMMILNENGKLEGDANNNLANKLYHNPYDYIVGDVIVLSDHHDSEMYYLTKEEYDLVSNYLFNTIPASNSGKTSK